LPRAAARHLASLEHLDVVVPDVATAARRVVTLGGTRLELHDVGRNHHLFPSVAEDRSAATALTKT